MRESAPPLAGLFRVLYFLAATTVTVLLVVTALTSFYEPPNGGDEFRFEGNSSFAFDEDSGRGDYNRNFGLINGLAGAAIMATAILGLGSRFNALRCGLLVGGLALFSLGIGFGSGGSDDWLAFLVAAIGFATVVGTVLWLDEGLPLGASRPPPRTIDIGPPPSQPTSL